MASQNPRKIREHKYHAEATAVHGTLELPISQKIKPQAHAKVRPIGGYESQHAEPFRVEGIVSYTAAHTQVAGHLEDQAKKPGSGFKTMSTSVVENLNILNVVTADRVVAQISTEHPQFEDEGHVPSVTFLGTQFYNLRIAGFPVEVELDLALLNPEEHSPKVSYSKNEAFLRRLADRLDIFRKGDDIPADLRERYRSGPSESNGKECTEYSLVKTVKGPFPGRNFGHVLDIPHFGKVYLGVVCIKHSDYEESIPKTTLIELRMVEVRMGCLASGTVVCASGKTNGGTTPGGG